jgi:FKBP-type peptidyl-prolyl cis-trans isomerase 2
VSINTNSIIVGGIMIALIGGTVGYAVITYSSQSSNSNKSLTTQTNNTAQPTSESTLKANNEQSITQGQGSGTLGVDSSQSGVSLQSNLGQSSGNGNAQTLPGPEAFGQYDQYANAATTMFAEPIVGTGKEATQGKKVAVIYQGWLTNGQLFDQSKKNDQGKLVPFVFTLGENQVIPGWEQGIAGMKVGGKRRLVIPPSLGYGAQGQGSIPPNALLVFDVELVDAK